MLSVCERDSCSNFCTSYLIFMTIGMNAMPLLLTQTCEAGVTVQLYYGLAKICW